MLVLSRRTDEAVVIPGLDIQIKVIKTKGNQVQLGISAPDHVRILRGELESWGDDEYELHSHRDVAAA